MTKTASDGIPWFRARKEWAGKVLIPLLLGAAVLLQASLFRGATSGTYDEGIFLHLGFQVFREGNFEKFGHHGVGPLPILLAYAFPVLVSGADAPTPAVYARLIDGSRVMHTLLIGIPLVLAVYAWLTRRRGIAAGAVGGALFAFSPTVLTYVSLVAVDACLALAVLGALAAMAGYLARPTRGRYALVVVAVALALASKYSAVFLLAIACVVLAVAAARRAAPGPRPRRLAAVAVATAGRMALLLAAAFLVVWACHGFAWSPLLVPGNDNPTFARIFGSGPLAESILAAARRMSVPAPVRGFLCQVSHGLMGHPAFLMGERSLQGWWYYFPVVFLLKSTPAELLAALGAAVLAARGWRAFDATARLWAGSLLLYGILAIRTPINGGNHYLLVMYPLLVLFAVDSGYAPAGVRPRLRRGIAGVLLVLQVASAISISPHYLSHFNLLAGGPREGYRFLVGSNLDYGQDLPSLRREMDRLGAARVLLAYHGTAPSEAYGVSAVPWETPEEMRPAGSHWIAISANYLQGCQAEWIPASKDPFALFRSLHPAARAGDSIFIYDLRDPAARAALAAARAAL